MAFARGIVFLLISFTATIVSFGGEMADGELSGGVLYLNILAAIFGWLAARDLWRKARAKAPRQRNLSGGQIDSHLQRHVAEHLKQIALEQQRPLPGAGSGWPR